MAMVWWISDVTDYTWQQALVAYSGHLIDKSGINVDSSEMRQALALYGQARRTPASIVVTLSFDEGRVAFLRKVWLSIGHKPTHTMLPVF